MKIHTRRTAAVAGIAILVAAAGSGTISGQGHARQQQATDEVVIAISAVSRDHQDRGHHRSTHRTHRADWSERNGSSHGRTGKSRTAQNPTAEVGVEAAAAPEAWGQAARQPSDSADLEVVLKSLPGIDSAGADADGADSASRDSAGEWCS